MKLKDYRIKVAKLSRAKAAEQLGLTGNTIWRIEAGRQIPKPANMIAITRWSKGQVTADDLLKAAKGRVR
jgi:DNA-binding XRE family transcriptional regulator